MSLRVHCYLRTHRRVWGFTQKELARLIGCQSATQVSRIERGKRVPRVELAFACQVLFGISVRDLFPQLYDSVEESVMRNTYALHEKLVRDRSLAGARKKELLALALKRAITKPKHLEKGV